MVVIYYNCQKARRRKNEKVLHVKEFYEEERELQENGASDRVISTHRKIWDLASKGWTLSRVGEERKRKAAALLRAVHREWNLKDQALEWDQYDNDHARRLARSYDKKDDLQIKKLQKLCKALGLTLEMSTFAHVAAYTKNGRREIL